MGSHFGVGAPPIFVYFSGDWDVHCKYGILSHGQVEEDAHPAPLTALRHTSRRDFPRKGDSTWCVVETSGTRHERLVLLRPEDDGRYRYVAVAQIPEDCFAMWATFQFLQLLDGCKISVARTIKALTSPEARELDENLYLHLSMTAFQRGNPFLPAEECPTSVCVDSGKSLGLLHWERFKGEFRLAEYVKVFLARMGEDIRTFDSIDGRRLSPHHCVVLRDQWQRVRGRFLEALRVQRAAYRRGSGGSNAPSIREQVEPKFLPGPLRRHEPRSLAAQLVVRNTFWDVLEHSRAPRRRRTVQLPVMLPAS